MMVKEREFNDLLLEWNKKINLVSRRKTDTADLIEDSKLFFDVIDFREGLNILDLGTGGGFPGIIIAINHPEAILTLIDSIQKKTKVVADIAGKLGLTNVKVICARAEELSKDPDHKNKYEYVVARSVALLQELAKWSHVLIKPGGKLVAVKGGDIKGEIKATERLKFVNKVIRVDENDRIIVSVEFV